MISIKIEKKKENQFIRSHANLVPGAMSREKKAPPTSRGSPEKGKVIQVRKWSDTKSKNLIFLPGSRFQFIVSLLFRSDP